MMLNILIILGTWSAVSGIYTLLLLTIGGTLTVATADERIITHFLNIIKFLWGATGVFVLVAIVVLESYRYLLMIQFFEGWVK